MIKKFVFVMFIIAAVACMSYADSKKQSILPPDAYGSCLVKNFSNWQTQPGVFNAANSLMFEGENHCDFYKWSWHMFLWLTSRGGDELVYNSGSFFNVIPEPTKEHPNQLKLTQEGQSPRVRGSKNDEFTSQARSAGILMSQNFDASIAPDGSLVFYSVHVNDVYAYFLSGVKAGKISATEFPTTETELQAIEKYANKKFMDRHALTMELKTSWVELTKKMNPKDYITTKADIPSYKMNTSKTKLTWNGKTMEKGVTLALVGFHVVGSVKGHPEMIWATFEHMDNAPNGDYTYTVAPPRMRPKSKKRQSRVSIPMEPSKIQKIGCSLERMGTKKWLTF